MTMSGWTSGVLIRCFIVVPLLRALLRHDDLLFDLSFLSLGHSESLLLLSSLRFVSYGRGNTISIADAKRRENVQLGIPLNDPHGPFHEIRHVTAYQL